MAPLRSPRVHQMEPDLPATARFRTAIYNVESLESLVGLFAEALAEHGVTGHFCVSGQEKRPLPILGDTPSLVADASTALSLPVRSVPGVRLLLAVSRDPTRDELVRIKGYAELYVAQVMALRELLDDVQTGCGLTLRERYVLGRRLAGLDASEIAWECGLSVRTISATIDSALSRLSEPDLTAAVALAARRGWLAVTSLQNCSLTPENLTYKASENG